MSISYFIKALDNQNHAEALSIISTQGFFTSLTPQTLHLIKSRVFSADAIPYPTTLKLLTLSLLIINNTKLQPRQQKLIVQYLTQTLKTSTYKEICAGLLVRLSNFQNKHTVLTHLHPNAIPLNLMVDVAAEIRKNKPSALERQLLKYREEWVLLLNGFEFSLEGLKEILTEYKELKEGTEYQLMKRIEGEVGFIVLRIRTMYNQKIDLDGFCQVIESMIEAEDNQKILSEFSIPICRLLQRSAYTLINEMILKLQKRFIRKYQWLVKIMEYAVKTISQHPDLTIKILNIIKTIQKVFGNGALETESIIFSSKSALIVLLENLLVSSDNSQLFNMQTPTLNHNKTKNISELAVKKIDNPYPEFVKNINKKQKQELITEVLEILVLYYKQPHESTYLVKLSDILDEHEHKLSSVNKRLYDDIKQLIFPKSIVYSPGLEQVYQQIILGNALQTFIKRRKIDLPQPFPTHNRSKQPSISNSSGMKLIQSKHNPLHSITQSNYFSCNQNPLTHTHKHPNQPSQINSSYYSFKDTEMFKSCKTINKGVTESYYSFPEQKEDREEEDPLENALPLEPTQQLSMCSFMKNQSGKRGVDQDEEMERISQKNQDRDMEVEQFEDNQSISQVGF